MKKPDNSFGNYLAYLLAACRIRTNDPEITSHVLWPAELRRHVLFSNGKEFSRKY